MKSQSIFSFAKLTSRPPSRGAWIEIIMSLLAVMSENRRPPSRGAWIEIK